VGKGARLRAVPTAFQPAYAALVGTAHAFELA
jgi:hypothetical protein